MAWAIKDATTNEYFRQRVGPKGWYGLDIDTARLYTSDKQAQKTIDAAEHHVWYPGTRNLIIKEVKLVEV
jgi:hypothetical protein